jgi:hypothetical protein
MAGTPEVFVHTPVRPTARLLEHREFVDGSDTDPGGFDGFVHPRG